MKTIPVFLVKPISIAVCVALSSLSYAGTAKGGNNSSQGEIDQLRAEVQELKAMLQAQQQQMQQLQSNQTAVQHSVDSAKVAAAQTPAAPVAQPQGISLTTAKGAAFKLYGAVRADANYVIEGADSDFAAPSSTKGDSKDKLNSTVKTTQLGIDFKQEIDGNKIGAKLETDFAGANDSFRIRHAYLTYNDWLVGQTSSNFLSNHSPELINFASNIGTSTTRLPQVRYSYPLSSTGQLFVAVEKGDSKGSDGKAAKYQLPTLTAKVQQGFADGQVNVSARGLVERYQSSNNTDLEATAWGVAAGIDIKLVENLKLSLDTNHIKGNSNVLYGANAGFSEVGNHLALNELSAVQLGVSYALTDSLRSTLAYGGMYAKEGEFAKNNPTANKNVQQVWFNLIYSPVKPLDFGIEYVNGARKTFSDVKLKDNRVGIMARYKF